LRPAASLQRVEWSPQAACLQPEPMEPLLQVEWSPQAGCLQPEPMEWWLPEQWLRPVMSSQRAAWLRMEELLQTAEGSSQPAAWLPQAECLQPEPIEL